MLQKLNEKIQGLIAWIVVGLIAVTFTLFGVDYFFQAKARADDVATVNGQSISKNDFDLTYRRAKQAREGGFLTKEADAQLRSDVLQEMILHTVSLQAAHKAGFTVDNNLVLTTISNIPEFQENGKFSLAKYQQALNSNLFTVQSFYKEVSDGMLINQQRFAFMGTAFVLSNELSRYIKLTMESRDFNYLVIPFLNFLKPDSITDAEIKSYFNERKENLKTDEMVSIEYVQLSLKDLMSDIHVSDEQAHKVYIENQMQDKPFDEVKETIKAQIKSDMVQTEHAKKLELLSDLSYQTPDTLAPVAEELKLNIQKTEPFSMKGGKEGITKNRKVIETAFSNDVLALGNNSEPIQIDSDSVVVLRVVQKYPIRQKTLAEVKDDIRETLAFAKAKESAKQFGQQVVAQNNVDLAQESLSWREVKDSSRESPKAPQAINEIAFNLPRDGQAATTLAGGDYVIVKLIGVKEGNESALSSEQLANMREELETSKGLVEYELYIKNLLKGSRIKFM